MERLHGCGELADHGREFGHGGFSHGGDGRCRWGGGAVNGGGAEEDGVEVDEDRLEADTRLSRAWASRVAGPWLQSS